MTWIIDTSAFFKGGRRPGPAATVEGVLLEVEGGRARRELEMWLAAELRVATPQKASRDAVRQRASPGERERLSATDLDLLALALELKGVLLTADYTMQNLATALDIAVESVGEAGIAERRELEYWCRGCQARREAAPDCPVCGSDLTVRPVR